MGCQFCKFQTALVKREVPSEKICLAKVREADSGYIQEQIFECPGFCNEMKKPAASHMSKQIG